MTHEELLLFGERLRSRRTELGLTQERVAEATGITLRFYQMLERGEKSVSVDTLLSLSRTLNISVDHLLLGKSSHTLAGPIADIIASLDSSQRADAAKILQLYSKACQRD